MAISDNLRAIVEHLIKPTRFYGFYLYEVTGFAGADPLTRRPDLAPVENADGLPALPAVDRIPGFTGVAESFKARTATERGTLVLVGFRGGNPSKPFVAFTLPTTPTAIDVYVGGAGKFSVHGSPSAGAAASVAKKDKVTSYIAALDVYLAAIVAALPTPVAVAPATTAYQNATAPIKASMGTTRLASE